MTYLISLTSKLIQGPQDVIHEDKILLDPGVVKRCCESMFAPIEWTGALGDVDEEPIRLGVGQILGGTVSMGAGRGELTALGFVVGSRLMVMWSWSC